MPMRIPQAFLNTAAYSRAYRTTPLEIAYFRRYVLASIFMPYFSPLAGACRIARKISLRVVRITGFEPFFPRRQKLYFDGCKLNTNVPVRDPSSAKGCA
jgi:hypothetical protein